ncbi:MAG: RbsD/FucU domain-containing protein [Bacteroidales bacterium]
MKEDKKWEQELDSLLPLMGHRNWIAIVDSAYPYQSNESIMTIDTSEDIISVTDKVLKLLNKADHIRPIIYRDAEFDYMDDDLLLGTKQLKVGFNNIFEDLALTTIPHDDIFSLFEKAASLFKIIILKTNCKIPYSSTFISLDCGYWPSDKETALRKKMEGK